MSPFLRRVALGGIVVLVLGLGGFVALRRAGAMPEPRPVGARTETVVPGLHLIGGLGPSAAYAVETSDGLVLIDTGLGADGMALRSELIRLKLDPRALKAILLTHVHGDHCGAAEALRAATGAKVHAGKGDSPTLRAGTPREAFFSIFDMPDEVAHKTTVDVELSGGETLTFGDTTFEAIAGTGHTPGSMLYRMKRRGLTALFGGDVITMLRGDGNPHPMGLRPLGTYSAYLSPRFRGDAAETLETLKRLRALPVPDLVLPGHPGSDPVPESPRLSASRWQEMLDDGIREMETLLARYEADGADFLDGAPKKLLPGLYYLGEFGGVAVYAIEAGTRLVLVDAPGGPGLPGFVRERLAALGVNAEPPSAVLLTSCNPRETAGLADLLKATNAEVFIARDWVDRARKSLPAGARLRAAEELSGGDLLDARPIALTGRGVAPTAYVLSCGGKRVLISGRIPILFDAASISALAADLATSRDDVMDYLEAISRLAPVAPDLWLPAVPSQGQNANLYEADWPYVIENNYRAGYARLEALKGRR